MAEMLNAARHDYCLKTTGYTAAVSTDRDATANQVSAVVKRVPLDPSDRGISMKMADIYFQDAERKRAIQSATEITFDEIQQYCVLAELNTMAGADGNFRLGQLDSGKPKLLIIYPPGTDYKSLIDKAFWHEA